MTKRRTGTLLTALLVLSLLFVCGLSLMREADAREKVIYKGETVGRYDKKGRIVFQPSKDAKKNRKALNSILGSNKKKTVVIPSGKTVKVDGRLILGNNTTIIATGATIVQVTPEKGLIAHTVDGNHYNAVKNITIDGGTWKSDKNTGVYTMMRFAHARNITIKNATVYCNYQSHAVELIACRNVVVKNCTLKAKNSKTKTKDSVEEALQIDIATPKTAPGVYSETGKKKYVNGQVCRDITVKNCTISGSRGLCANYAASEPKFQNRYHRYITITGCRITGETAEGVALFNAVGVTMKNNVIKTNSTRSETAYANGVTMILFRDKDNFNPAAYENIISGNTIYGNYHGIVLASKCSERYGTTTIKNNNIYVKDTKLALSVKDCQKSTLTGNKTGRI